MEAFALYLFKSVIWLSGFTLVFFLFLRNERFFLLNRIYLLAGILTSLLFPFISVHYTVLLPSVLSIQTGEVTMDGIPDAGSFNIRQLSTLMLALYISGALIVAFLLLKQTRSVLRIIKKAEITPLHPVKLIRTAEYTSSFSFFSYVFVNPSVTDIETKEIVNHELAHLRQKHWFDLVLVELLCMLQWFNPLVWIYIRFVRQNHEYLADEVALQRTASPAIYRATLLNQIVGAPVVNLANSFNYSTNKKRFNMMKNIIRSPYRKMKILLILPLFAIVLYSFAKPEYRYEATGENSGNNTISELQMKEVKGIVVQRDGKPLGGTIITLRGTTIGTVADDKGYFKLHDLPEDGLLVVSYVGFKTKVVKPVFTSDMKIEMVIDTVKYYGAPAPPPPSPPPLNVAEPKMDAKTPPPPPANVKIRSANGKAPLIVVDGTIKNIDMDEIAPESIESVVVMKDKSATNKYGEKGKDGVIEITTKKVALKKNEEKLAKFEITEYGSRDTVKVSAYGGVQFRRADGGVATPLVVVDGVILNIDVNKIDPETIQSITVIKEGPAFDKYGKKGKDGVIEITTKKVPAVEATEATIKEDVTIAKDQSPVKQENEKAPFVVVESYPEFPGGNKAMNAWISQNLRYPAEAAKNKITGKVSVSFTVNSAGKVTGSKVIKSVSPLFDAEAIRLISSMPDWKPALQDGKPVDVQIMVPVEFILK